MCYAGTLPVLHPNGDSDRDSHAKCHADANSQPRRGHTHGNADGHLYKDRYTAALAGYGDTNRHGHAVRYADLLQLLPNPYYNTNGDGLRELHGNADPHAHSLSVAHAHSKSGRA